MTELLSASWFSKAKLGSRRNGPRVALDPDVTKKIDEIRGKLSRPEFVCRALWFYIDELRKVNNT